jgi:hypothetical protein
LVAGREKDIEFVRAMLGHRIVEASALAALSSELEPASAKLVAERLRRYNV